MLKYDTIPKLHSFFKYFKRPFARKSVITARELGFAIHFCSHNQHLLIFYLKQKKRKNLSGDFPIGRMVTRTHYENHPGIHCLTNVQKLYFFVIQSPQTLLDFEISSKYGSNYPGCCRGYLFAPD